MAKKTDVSLVLSTVEQIRFKILTCYEYIVYGIIVFFAAIVYIILKTLASR